MKERIGCVVILEMNVMEVVMTLKYRIAHNAGATQWFVTVGLTRRYFMSWASHNPELYDEMIRKGIQRYLEDALYRNGFTFPQNGDDDEMTALVEMFQEDPHFSKIYDNLMTLANAQICDAETNHFAGLADAARDRYKDKGV